MTNLRRAGVECHGGVAIDFDVYGGVRHVRADDGVGRPADVVAASHADAAAVRQFPFLLRPAGAFDHPFDAFRQAIAGDAQAVHGDARRPQQIATANLDGIESRVVRERVEHSLKGEAHVDGAVAPHGAAGGLVGEHAIAVVFHVGNVVDRAQQRAGVKHSDWAVAAVRAAVLHHASRHGADFALTRQTDFQVHNGDRPAAMRIEHLFARVGDLHRTLGLLGKHRRGHLERDHFTLTAKPAAHQRLDDADLAHGHFADFGDGAVQVVGHLRRGVHG